MPESKEFNEDYIKRVTEVIKRDKGKAAALRYADHPGLAYKSWDLLIKWGINLTDEKEALVYSTITAAMARAKVTSNGNLNIGRALLLCYPNGEASGELKLRRLTGARDVKRACKELNRLLSLISSRGYNVDYADLLFRLCSFGESAKKYWAMGFYTRREGGEL